MAEIEHIDGFDYLSDIASTVVRTPASSEAPGRLYIDATEDVISEAESHMQRALRMTAAVGYTGQEHVRNRNKNILELVSFETLVTLTATGKLPKETVVEGNQIGEKDMFKPGEVRLVLKRKAGEVADQIEELFDRYDAGEDSHVLGEIPARFTRFNLDSFEDRARLTRYGNIIRTVQHSLRRSHGVKSSTAPEGAVPASSPLRR